MKHSILKSLLLSVSLCVAFSLNAETITKEMIDGHNGYFKTYDDFLHDRGTHFDEMKIHHDKSQGKDHIIWTITFESKGAKTTLNMNEFWGYRFKGLLFRTYPLVDMGVIIVVAVGDMILYENYHSPHLFISDDGNRASYDNFTLLTYVSKNLGSDIVDKLAKLKPEQSDLNADIYNCNDQLASCYMTYNSISYVCKFPGYKQITHVVNHTKNNKPSGH
jgi:hypothetical protein